MSFHIPGHETDYERAFLALSADEEAAKPSVWQRILLSQREVDAVFALRRQGYSESETVNEILSLRIEAPTNSSPVGQQEGGREVPIPPCSCCDCRFHRVEIDGYCRTCGTDATSCLSMWESER